MPSPLKQAVLPLKRFWPVRDGSCCRLMASSNDGNRLSLSRMVSARSIFWLDHGRRLRRLHVAEGLQWRRDVPLHAPCM